MQDQEIKQMYKAKVQRWDNQSIGAMVGGIMHDAVAISTAKLGKEKASLVTREDYQKEIEFWLDWLLQLSQEKKDYLSIPVVEPEIIPIPGQISTIWEGQPNTHTQDKYNQRSKEDDILGEEKHIPF